ncbi:S-layer homology domain-containing protein [Deinococcus sp. DB0503]|uniref:S-layer homology domain-containing protein n=1 Tax=Deinococcus sp. DB0503 TaxID=2479203 RepID=UPI0018DF1C8C|nr:S-layer homology domain-containing protein [Deinococcus sp. DB0503]MBI0446559.1 S-layer protein [Deinococcus sp. DB0503]
MKKSLFVLTAALAFGVAAAQTAAPANPAPASASAPQVPTLTDVPAGHWAKDAIDRLVSRGIILGYPDGTYRGTQNLTRYEAAVIIARLLDQIRTGEVSPSSITPEDLTALQNAIQELAADLTALGVRVSDLEENAVNRDDFARLEARVEELATTNGDAAAVADLKGQIDELTSRVDELSSNYDALRADVDDNASSIAALNDLTVLLNQDILNLQDRVSAVESAQADFVQRSDFDNLAGRVGAIDTRVTTLENAPKFSIGGTLNAAYGRLALVEGNQNFDVDRLTNGTFAAKAFGTGAVNGPDTSSDFNNAGSLTFGVRASNLTTASGAIVVNSANLNFGLTDVTNTSGSVVPVLTLTDATANGTIGGQKFDVRYNFRSNAFKFSDYLFNNTAGVSGRGIVANIQATQLPLQPTITVVTGATTSPALTGASGTPAPSVNYFGVRGVVKPNADSTVGLSYAQASRTGFGVDYSLKYGVFTVKGEGVISAVNAIENNFLAGNAQGFFTNGNKAFYTDVTADVGIVTFGVNYRTIDPAFAAATSYPIAAGVNAGMSVSTGSRPYAPDQVGFGAALGTAVGPIALGAYADSYTTYAGEDRTTGFGVKAGGKLGALELVGFYNRVTVNNNVVDGSSDYLSSDLDINNNSAGMGIANVPFAMTSSFGAQLSHDGQATNALVKNLDFTVANAYFYTTRTNSFAAYADYTAAVAGLTLEPLVRYHLVTSPNNDVAANTFKYGVKISTQPLAGVPFQPSAYFNIVNRITNSGTGLGVNNATTTELLGQVGVSLNQFLAPNTTARVGYSYYQGFNVDGVSIGNSSAAPFDASDSRIYGSRGNQNGIVNGIFAQVGFYGLNANYGVFRYTNLNTGTTNTAQGFKVNYTFNF